VRGHEFPEPVYVVTQSQLDLYVNAVADELRRYQGDAAGWRAESNADKRRLEELRRKGDAVMAAAILLHGAETRTDVPKDVRDLLAELQRALRL
jgi:hypothetical protein